METVSSGVLTKARAPVKALLKVHGSNNLTTQEQKEIWNLKPSQLGVSSFDFKVEILLFPFYTLEFLQYFVNSRTVEREKIGEQGEQSSYTVGGQEPTEIRIPLTRASKPRQSPQPRRNERWGRKGAVNAPVGTQEASNYKHFLIRRLEGALDAPF